MNLTCHAPVTGLSRKLLELELVKDRKMQPKDLNLAEKLSAGWVHVFVNLALGNSFINT